MRTIPRLPPTAKYLLLWLIETEHNSSDSPLKGLLSKISSSWAFLRSQYVIFLSCPTEMYLFGSLGEILKELIPPILWVWADTRFSAFKSQQRIERSRAHERRWISSANKCRLVTLLVCSFKCETSSRDLISQTRTSPYIPPEQMNLQLDERVKAVTPSLCALAICQSN